MKTATVDRMRDKAHRVLIDGESYRKPKPVPRRGKAKIEQ